MEMEMGMGMGMGMVLMEMRMAQDVISHPSTKLMSPTNTHGVTFADCMALFTSGERLDGDSRYF